MRHLDLVAIRSLVAVADTEGVTRAAQQINLTQSAVSMQIKRLEQLTGTTLLQRKGRGVELTDAGEQLVGYGRQLLAVNDEAWARLTLDEYEGELTIGVPFDIVYPQIPFVLQVARRRYPRVKVHLVSALTKDIKAQYSKGKIDIALTTERGVGQHGETLLEADQQWWGAVGGKAHRQSPLPVALCNSCALRPDLVRILGSSGTPWEFVSDTDAETTVHAMVTADLAVTATVETQNLRNCERIPNGILPDLSSVMINLYTETSRNPALAQKIADIVREAYLYPSDGLLKSAASR